MTTVQAVAFGAFALAGLVYAGICMDANDKPFSPVARRLVAGVLLALVLSAGTLSVSVYAADKYDMCNDPTYQGTWYWYAWGCWMY